MKNKVRLLGWEKYALDEEGKRYIKDKFVFYNRGLICGTLYTEVNEKYSIIYEIKAKQKVELAKIRCEQGENVIFSWEGVKNE